MERLHQKSIEILQIKNTLNLVGSESMLIWMAEVEAILAVLKNSIETRCTSQSQILEALFPKLLSKFTEAGRVFGHSTFLETSGSATNARGSLPTCCPAVSHSQLLRSWLFNEVCSILSQEPDMHSLKLVFFEECFYRGDMHEQIASMHALDRECADPIFLDSAVDALRTSNSKVFAALTLNNRYPFMQFSDSQWAQMILKALFLDLDIGLIYGVESRVTLRLFQLVQAYKKELLSAGRPVKNGISLLEGICKTVLAKSAIQEAHTKDKEFL